MQVHLAYNNVDLSGRSELLYNCDTKIQQGIFELFKIDDIVKKL